MSEREIVSWLLILLAGMDVLVTTVLIRAARRLKEPALEERATISLVLTVGAIMAASLGAFYLLDYALPPSLSFVFLVTILMVVSAPQLVWYVAYRVGRFK